MKVFRPISIWHTAELSDKATAYFRHQTPKNEKILYLASEKACAILFRKYGADGKALAQDKKVFDSATMRVFNILKETQDYTAPCSFTKGFFSAGLLFTAALFFARNLSIEQNGAGKWLLTTSLVASFMATVTNLQVLSDFSDEIMNEFEQVAKPASARLAKMKKKQAEDAVPAYVRQKEKKVAPRGNFALD